MVNRFNQWLLRLAIWVDEKYDHRYQWFCILIEDYFDFMVPKR